jgi:hypothetical protein
LRLTVLAVGHEVGGKPGGQLPNSNISLVDLALIDQPLDRLRGYKVDDKVVDACKEAIAALRSDPEAKLPARTSSADGGHKRTGPRQYIDFIRYRWVGGDGRGPARQRISAHTASTPSPNVGPNCTG